MTRRTTPRGQQTLPPADTQNFFDDGSVPELGGARPDRLVDVRPQAGLRRHGGIGHELVLETAVPQLGVEEDVHGAVRKDLADRFVNWMAEYERRRIQAASARSSSSKGNKMRRKKKKKTPKTHSSSSFICQSSSRGGVGIQGTMHDEFEDVGTVHAEPLNSVHDKGLRGTWTR